MDGQAVRVEEQNGPQAGLRGLAQSGLARLAWTEEPGGELLWIEVSAPADFLAELAAAGFPLVPDFDSSLRP
jgi:hypothetical protein